MADKIELYKVAVNEEQHFLEAHQKRVQFYSSLLSAIFAGTVAGALNVKDPNQYFVLLGGPFLIFSISLIALGGTFRLYQRFIEAIVVRAKIEQTMGLTFPEQGAAKECYWQGEPILAPRHIESRHKYAKSEDFVSAHKKTGYQKFSRQLFYVFAIAAVLLGIMLLLLGMGVVG